MQVVTFGRVIHYEDEEKDFEEKFKEQLKQEMHAMIDEQFDKEDFWFKVERDPTGKDALRRENSIAWKISIHQQGENAK